MREATTTARGRTRFSRANMYERTYYSDQGRPVETADIAVPAAH
ncbi:hypothetical protein ACFU5B_06525 [Streptomyces murinus]